MNTNYTYRESHVSEDTNCPNCNSELKKGDNVTIRMLNAMDSRYFQPALKRAGIKCGNCEFDFSIIHFDGR